MFHYSLDHVLFMKLTLCNNLRQCTKYPGLSYKVMTVAQRGLDMRKWEVQVRNTIKYYMYLQESNQYISLCFQIKQAKWTVSSWKVSSTITVNIFKLLFQFMIIQQHKVAANVAQFSLIS